jgi:hypothetical protein
MLATRMKKVMLLFVLLLALPAVVAHDDAGVGPNSFLWKADLFFERLNIALTFDTSEKIRIHLLHAGERLSEAADEDAAERALEQRAKDIDAAYVLFTDIAVTDALVLDVRETLTHQAEEAPVVAVEQQAAFEVAVASYEITEALETVAEQETATKISSPPITAAVVVEQEDIDTENVETDEVEETETEDTSTEQITERKTSDSIIQVTIEDADLAYVHIYINGIEKNFALATGYRPAIIKEISKRTFLTIEEVEDITIFTGP